MSVQIPPVNAPYISVNGMVPSWVDATHISIGVGHARDSTNVNDIYNFGTNNGTGNPITAATALTINAAVNGANGLDTGALGNNLFYAILVIGDSSNYNPTAGMLSLSATAPALPLGYDMFRRVGFVKTSGAAALLAFWMDGANSARRIMWYDAPISVLAATAAAAFTAQSLAVAVPVAVGQTTVILQADLLPNVAAEFVELRPTGSAAAAGNVKMSGDVAAVHHFDQLHCIAAVSAGALSIDWITDAASTVALTVSGYVDKL